MRRIWMIALLMAFVTTLAHTQQTVQPAEAHVSGDQSSAKNISPPELLNQVEGEFSDEARAKRISGRCVVSLIVDKYGIPQNIKITRCSDPSFGKSSIDAAAKYRFKPATKLDGTPVPVMIQVEIEYHWDKGNPLTPIRYEFSSPPGMTSAAAGVDGVYPLSKVYTPPSITKFSDEGYGPVAYSAKENGGCDIVITIDAKGKPSDPQVTHCGDPELEAPAVRSLLMSRYKPGRVNGKAVPMRASIHLEYGDVPPKP